MSKRQNSNLYQKRNVSLRLKVFLPITVILSIAIIGLVTSVIYYQRALLGDLGSSVVQSLKQTNTIMKSHFDGMQSDVKGNFEKMAETASKTLSASTAEALDKEKKALTTEWENVLQEHARAQAQLLARVAPTALLSNNFLELIAYAKSASENPNVVYAVYLNPKGEPLTRYLNRKDPLIKKFLKAGKAKNKVLRVIEGSQKDELVFTIENPIELEGKNLGKVMLCVSKASSHEKIEKMSSRFKSIIEENKKTVRSVLGTESANVTQRIDSMLITLHSQSKKALVDIENTIVGSCETIVKKTKNIITLIGGLSFILVLGILFIVVSKTSKSIRHIAAGLRQGSEEVVRASSQVSSSSQQLAEGSSEQAASIEETSSSLEEMSSMTKQNADNANQADNLMKDANQVVRKANDSMTDLTTSMEEISKASEETSKIIKTIDEIAFQTNLLALNAAVEAARAGEAGAGFAVVADEVRNLAMRAADAARDTAELIEGTVKKTKDGTELVTKTNEAFAEVATSAAKVGELVGEIAAASNEQAEGIEQVNKAVVEMDKVVQQNAANAEESASAAEEMNAQAEQMKGVVDDLVALVGGGVKKALDAPITKEIATRAGEVKPEQVIPMDNEDFRNF